jgi:hypothetical protein
MWLIIVSFCFVTEVKAISFTPKTEFEYQAQQRFLNQSGLSADDTILDHYLIAKSNLLMDLNPSWGFEVQPELRLLWSDGTELPSTDAAALELPQADRRFLSNKNFNFERLNVIYRFERGELLAGRRAVTLGNFRTLIILNKFAQAPLQSQGYPFYFGQDGATLSYGESFYQMRAISILGAHSDRDVHLLENKISGNGFETQILAGRWWDRWVIGFAPTIDVYGSSIRGELLSVPKDSMLQAGLGFERALDTNFKLVIESMYQSLGITDGSQISSRSPSPYMIFRSKFLALAQIDFTGLSFWNFSTGFARSFSDDSMMGALRVQYSASDHWDLYVDSRFPLTSTQGEFSSKILSFPGGRQVGQTSYVSLGVKFFF